MRDVMYRQTVCFDCIVTLIKVGQFDFFNIPVKIILNKHAVPPLLLQGISILRLI